jgi:hypothetical protein
MHDVVQIPNLASRGGQGETLPASDPTAARPEAGVSVPSSDLAALVAPVLVEQAASASGHELAIDAGDVVRGPGGAVLWVGGAAYVPAGAEVWYEAMQQAAAREAAPLSMLPDQADPEPAAPDPAETWPELAPRRVPPSDPKKANTYYKLLGRAAKVQRTNPGQATALRLKAQALMELTTELPDRPVPRPAPAATAIQSRRRAGVCNGGESPPPPPSLPGSELPEDGWGFEWAGSGWRAVHTAGYVTHCYISPEAARRAIDRWEYTALAVG